MSVEGRDIVYHAGDHQERKRWSRQHLTTARPLTASLQVPVSRHPYTPSTATLGTIYRVLGGAEGRVIQQRENSTLYLLLRGSALCSPKTL